MIRTINKWISERTQEVAFHFIQMARSQSQEPDSEKLTRLAEEISAFKMPKSLSAATECTDEYRPKILRKFDALLAVTDAINMCMPDPLNVEDARAVRAELRNIDKPLKKLIAESTLTAGIEERLTKRFDAFYDSLKVSRNSASEQCNRVFADANEESLWNAFRTGDSKMFLTAKEISKDQSFGALMLQDMTQRPFVRQPPTKKQ